MGALRCGLSGAAPGRARQRHERASALHPPGEEDGSLIPAFIVFANTIPVDPAQVIRGNEKVLRARLADARFFFDEDKKTRLDALYEKLEAVMFHKRLGSLKDKAERIAVLASGLASALGVTDRAKIERAAMLIKADLLTHMVGEFPELQGTMGRIYALYQGEERDVARSIEEHYYPSGTDGRLPETALGALMAMADKMDSLIAFFSVGITPTGNLDPFALRRQALGAIKIVIDRACHVALPELIEKGFEALGGVEGKVPLETLKGDALRVHRDQVQVPHDRGRAQPGIRRRRPAGRRHRRVRRLHAAPRLRDARIDRGFPPAHGRLQARLQHHEGLERRACPGPRPHAPARGAGPLRPVRGEEGRIPAPSWGSGATRRRSACWWDSRRP